jgi:hypothetical protein
MAKPAPEPSWWDSATGAVSDAWEAVKAAPGQLYDEYLKPDAPVSIDSKGRVFQPPKPDKKGVIRQPYPAVDLSLSAMWKNFHPIDSAFALVQGIGQLPQAGGAISSLKRGMMLIENDKKFNAYKRAHPRVPDASNPYYMSPQKYRQLRIAADFDPDAMATYSPLQSRYKNPQLEMQKDRFVAQSAVSSYSYTDKNGVQHTDFNHLRDTINRNPVDVITTIIPFLGQATKLAQSGKLAATLARLAEGTGIVADMGAAYAPVVRAINTGAKAVAESPVGRGTKFVADTAMKVADPLTEVVLPKAVGAAAKGATRIFGSNGIEIFNPEFAKAWSDHLSANGLEDADDATKNDAFQQFQRVTGGQYGDVFNPQTVAAIREAGFDPARFSSPSQWEDFQKQLSRTGQVISPAGVRQAVAKMAGAKSPTTSAVTQQPGSYLWTRTGREQAARNTATGQIDANLQSQFGTDIKDFNIARHAVHSVLGGGTSSPVAFRSPTLSNEYIYYPSNDTFVLDRGSSYVPRPGGSRYATIDSSSPQFGILKNDVSGIVTNSGMAAAKGSPNPLFRKIEQNYRAGITDPDNLAESVQGLVPEHILDQTGSISRPKNELPGQLNYDTLRSGLGTEGQQALDAYLKQRLVNASDPNAALVSSDVLQSKNPDFFRPDERPLFETGVNGRSVVNAPVDPASGRKSFIEYAKSKIAPDTTNAAFWGLLLGQSPTNAALAATANLAWNAGEQLVSPLGLSDRFGAPIALDPSKWISGNRPTAPVPALGAEATRLNQQLVGYGNQFDENQKPKPPVAPPAPPPVLSKPIDINDTASAPAAIAAQKSGKPFVSQYDMDIEGNTSQPTGGGKPFVSQYDMDDPMAPKKHGGRIAYKKGGAVNSGIEHLVQGLMSRYKAVKRSQDSGTKTLLRQPDQAIVKALDVAQKAI